MSTHLMGMEARNCFVWADLKLQQVASHAPEHRCTRQWLQQQQV
jgi:hypothetical protein